MERPGNQKQKETQRLQPDFRHKIFAGSELDILSEGDKNKRNKNKVTDKKWKCQGEF